MEFYSDAGPMALGTRLRALAAHMTEEAEQIYAMYGVAIDPRWFPVFYVLRQGQIRTVVEIARFVGQSHGAVSQVAKAMQAAGLIDMTSSSSDGRTRELKLSAKGMQEARKLDAQILDVGTAVENLAHECGISLWKALDDTEKALEQSSLVHRVRSCREQRLRSLVEIRHFKDEDTQAFAALNLSWIERHFVVEDQDREALFHPQTQFIDSGGCILVAELEGEVVGVIAMAPHDSESVELAKMTVREDQRGLGIGRRLAEAFFEEARSKGYKRVFLESNTKLDSAIHLYRQLGFNEFEGDPSEYARCDIQMQKFL